MIRDQDEALSAWNGDSLLDSKRWSRVIFGCWQFTGVTHELEGRRMFLGGAHACLNVAPWNKVRDNFSANCVLSKIVLVALAYSIQWRLVCTESLRNPADHDSRAVG